MPINRDVPNRLIERLRAGDPLATQALVEIYYDRLVGLARKRLHVIPPQVADGEGAVISALRSFFSGIGKGQMEQIQDQQDLWRVLATITARKAIRQIRVHCKKSGEADQINHNADLERLVSPNADPKTELELMEEFQDMVDALDQPLQEIVLLKLQGLDNSEVAAHLSIHIRSVQRKLKLVESIWTENLPE
ncbi:MAG: ECF-type sigma factor [Planctomycetota bacterium]